MGGAAVLARFTRSAMLEVVVESVFSWPGVGRLLVVAVADRDLAVVQCILLLVAATMVAANLVVDLLYGVLDPRLRVGAASAH